MSVIKEVPVFLSKQCMESLLLFEFPNRPKQNPIKESSVVDCRYKPKYNYAELWLSLDTGSANYERHRGQELGRLAPEQFSRAGGLYDRQLLRSQPAGQAARRPQHQWRRLAVARFHGDRLVLCPMPAAASTPLVMEPALDHLDVKLADSAASAAAAADAAIEAKAVTPRFARQETPEARQRREQSYRACQRQLDTEPWLRCRWRGGGGDDKGSEAAACGVTVPMETEKAGKEGPPDQMETEDVGEEAAAGGGYLGRLCPAVSGDASSADASAMAASVTSAAVADQAPSVSLARLRAMPCAERLRALFKSACVLRWSQLVDLLKQCGMTHGQLTESLAQIHGHLTELACLVRGLWVVKSDVLYPAGSLSMYSGVPAEVMCRGRDYILCRFVQGRAVTRKEVASLVRMPSEEISQILGRISRVVRPGGSGDPGSGGHQHQLQEQKKAVKMRLVFVAEDDTEYIRRNPDVVKKAQYYWDAKWKVLTEQLKLDKEKASRAFRTSISIGDGGGGGGRRSRTSSARYSISSQSDCGGDAAAASDSSLSSAEGRRRHARSHRGQPRGGGAGGGQARARRSVSLCEDAAAAPSAAAPATSVASATASDEVIAEIRGFLQAKLQDRMVASQDELVRIHRVESGSVAPPMEEACLRRQLDLAAESLGFVVLPGGGGASGAAKIYAFVSDSLPHAGHRRELLAALKAGASAPQVTLGQLRERFELAGLEPLSEGSVKSLIKEYCAFKGKAYYAKGFLHAT